MNAPEPGPDVWINRNATVGATHVGEQVFGSRVSILTGAVVVGGIAIGDDSVITANALLPIAGPPNSTVHATRSVILPRRF